MRAIDSSPRSAEEFHVALDAFRAVRMIGSTTIHSRASELIRARLIDLRPRRHDVEVVAYFYTLLDAGQREIISYQMHTIRDTDRRHCHLHLGPGAGDLKPHLFKKHLPSGQVALAEIVWLLIEEYGVTPQRDDWREVLGQQ